MYKTIKLELKKHSFFYMIKASLHKREAFVVSICVEAFVVVCILVSIQRKLKANKYWIMVF